MKDTLGAQDLINYQDYLECALALGGTPLAGSALGILFPHPRRAEGPPETLITTKYTKNRQRLLGDANRRGM